MSRNRKKKQKIKKSQEKLLIETSMQEERVAKPNSAMSDALREVMKSQKADSSNYVLYEFKTGLILSWIHLFYHVKLFDRVEDAIAEWSDKYGRDPKRTVILVSLMLRLFGPIPSEKEAYLRRIETIIDYSLGSFMMGIDNIVGDFRSDKVVSFPIKGKDSYKEFLTLYGERKFIALREFWAKRSGDLDKMVASGSLFRKKDKRMHQYLEEMQNDMSRAEMESRCKSVGDAVIAADCPGSHRIVTSDEAFEVLCKSIEKKLCLIKGKKKDELKIVYMPENEAEKHAASET